MPRHVGLTPSDSTLEAIRPMSGKLIAEVSMARSDSIARRLYKSAKVLGAASIASAVLFAVVAALHDRFWVYDFHIQKRQEQFCKEYLIEGVRDGKVVTAEAKELAEAGMLEGEILLELGGNLIAVYQDDEKRIRRSVPLLELSELSGISSAKVKHRIASDCKLAEPSVYDLEDDLWMPRALRLSSYPSKTFWNVVILIACTFSLGLITIGASLWMKWLRTGKWR